MKRVFTKFKRYAVTHAGVKVFRNVRTLAQAEKTASEAIILSGNEFLFEVEVDKPNSVKAILNFVLRIMYTPIYFIGVVVLVLVRLQLALTYILLLKPDMSRNIIRHIFIWEKNHQL